MTLRESQELRLERLYPKTLVKEAVRTVLVPRPMTARIGGRPVQDTALLDWCTAFLDGVLSDVRPTGNVGSRVTSRTEGRS